MIGNTRLRLLAALVHCVDVLDDLKPCGHSVDEETGEHDDDCMLCRVEAALEHAEEEGVDPSSPLPQADVPPSPHGSVFGTDAVCMPPVSAEVMEIVKWLRVTPRARGVLLGIGSSQDIARLADAIERGEYRVSHGRVIPWDKKAKGSP